VLLDRLEQRLLMRDAAIKVLVQDAGLKIEQGMSGAAGPRRIGFAHLPDDVVVDLREDFWPERGFGDVRVYVDEKITFVAFGLPRRVRENIARIRLHGDFLQFAELWRNSLQHCNLPVKDAP